MINILLDELPTEWNGYRLDTDFQIGIQLILIQEDVEMSKGEKCSAMAGLLFCDELPSMQEMQECITWYLTGWNHDKQPKSRDHRKVMDFDIDQWRIYSAFLRQYRIDLNDLGYEPVYDEAGSPVLDQHGNQIMAERHLHFWTFMGLLANLEESNYSRVIEARQKKPGPKASREERKRISEAHEVFDLDQATSYEDHEFKEHIDELL